MDNPSPIKIQKSCVTIFQGWFADNFYPRYIALAERCAAENESDEKYWFAERCAEKVEITTL